MTNGNAKTKTAFRQSEITTWQECRRKHHFAYTIGASPIGEGLIQPAKSGRDAGTLAHRGVEVINKGGSLPEAHTAITDKVDELRAVRNPDPLLPLTKEDDKAWWEVDRLAKAMVSNYVEWMSQGNEIGVRVVEAEHAWEVEVPDTIFTVYGTTDAIVFDQMVDGIIVRDYKSVTTFAQTPEQVDFQLRTYAWAYWQETGVVPKRAEHLMMKRVLGTGNAKAPFFERYPIPIDEDILRRHGDQLEYRVTEMGKTLRAAGGDPEFPGLFPNPTRDCSWKCQYREVCPMVDDGSDYESMIEFNFVTNSGDDK